MTLALAASHDKQQGKNVTVLRNQYSVLLLTGPAKGEVIKFARTCVSGLPGSSGGAGGGGGPPNASGDAAANTGGGGEAMLATGGAKLASGDVGVLADDGGDALS